MNKFSNIWTPSNCLSKGQLLAYIEQKLDRDEVYLVESHLNDCQLCSDAIDGLIEEDTEMAQKIIGDIREEFDEKIKRHHLARKPELRVNHTINNEPPVRAPISTQPNHRYKWLAAASILLVVGLGGYSVYSYMKSQEQQLAQNKESFEGKDAEYNAPEDVHANEITTLRVNPTDSFKPTLPTDISKEDKSVKDVKEKPSSKEFKNENNANDEIVQEANIPPEVKTTTQAVEAPVARTEMEDMKENEKISPSEGMSNYMEEKKAVVAAPELVAKKKSSNIGLSNSKSTKYNQGNPQLSYPSTQNNNNNDNIYNSNQSNSESVKNLETRATTSSKDLKKPLDDYENAMKLYNEGEFKKSTEYFERALKTGTGTHMEDIQYQLALAYIKIGKRNKAEKLFEILALGSKYKKEASEQIIRAKK